MNMIKIMEDIQKCDDINEISDIVLMAAMRVHEIVSDVKGAKIELNGTHTKTNKRYSIGITRKE